MKAMIRVAGLFVLVTVGMLAIAVRSASAGPAVVETDRTMAPCETIGSCRMVPVDEAIIDHAIIDDAITDGGADGNGDDDPPADDPPADDSQGCDGCESETQGSALPKAGTGDAASDQGGDANLGIYVLAGLGVAGAAVALGLVLTARRRNSGVL